MKKLTALLLPIVFAGSVLADEVQLLCQGVVTEYEEQRMEPITDQHGSTKTHSVSIPYQSEKIREIRFDEEKKEFWLKGESEIKSKGTVDGWVPAKSVEFSDSQITAQFQGRGTLLFRNVGVSIDRLSGVFRMKPLVLNCAKVDLDNAKF